MNKAQISRALSIKGMLVQNIDSASTWVRQEQAERGAPLAGELCRESKHFTPGQSSCPALSRRCPSRASGTPPPLASCPPVPLTGAPHFCSSRPALLAGGIPAHASNPPADLRPHGRRALHQRVSRDRESAGGDAIKGHGAVLLAGCRAPVGASLHALAPSPAPSSPFRHTTPSLTPPACGPATRPPAWGAWASTRALSP